MSSSPPSEYFEGINFNYSFWSQGLTYVTKDYVDSNFLRSSGYAVSRAISTTFNNIVYFNGGFQTTNITATGTITANLFSGSGASLTTLNASTITDGTLPVARGGTGSNTLVSGQLLIGNGLNPVTQTSGLSWSSNTLTAANLTTGTLIATNQVSTNFTTTFMSGYKNTGYQLYFQNICSSANFIKSDGTDTSTIKTVNTIYGIYQLIATSVNATNSKIENIFDDNPATYWTTSAATYTRLALEANYSANSTYSVNVTNLGILYGESIQIRFPRKVYFKDVLYTPFSIATSITEGYILGSTNGSTWDPVYPINKFLTNLNEVSLVPTGYQLPAIYTTTTKAYQYFMFITTSIQGLTGYPVNSTGKCAITNLRIILYDNWVYHDNIIAIGSTPNGSYVSNALDVNGTAYISGKISTDGGISVLNGKLDVSGNIDAKSFTLNGNQFTSNPWLNNGTSIYYNSGNIGIGTTNPVTLLQIKGSNPALTISGQGGAGAKSQINLSVYDPGIYANACTLLAIDDGQFGAIFKINLKTTGSITNGQFTALNIGNNGNVGIGTTNSTYKLEVAGNSFFDNTINFNTLYYQSGAAYPCNKINLWGTNGNYGFGISGDTLDYFSNRIHRFLYGSGGSSLGTVGMSLDYNYLTVNGGASIGSDLFVSSSRLVLRGTSPTLYLRDTDNRSGMIHMNSNIMYFLNGAGNDSETWAQPSGLNWALQINMDYNEANFGGQIAALFYAVSMTNTDYLCVQQNFESIGSAYYKLIKVAYGSFTAFHRCYTDDVLYNNESDESIDLFKNNYMGRVVIATGKIKTDFSREVEENPNEEVVIDNMTGLPKKKKMKDEWYEGIDKEGISIEDSVPVVALSRKKKDKRVFGVLGAPKRSTNNKDRLIVNSIGEGAICVSNTNGNIENGDYLQSSDLLGYGEKQDDDLLHNYTIAKATIDCNFELDSPYYQCHEIENGVRVAFIACSYHCG